ncbi:MAG TPA: ABC transporter ATP-binding protein [Actinobacteria bacterium]|nr:ABC transporter ATP-binding protein [Actinomycetota bacterium]
MSAPLVSLQDVAFSAGKSLILRSVTLTVVEGEALGLFGGNGAGKTTLLRLVALLSRPSGGTVDVLGSATETDLAPVRRRIGMIGHTPALYPTLSLMENLSFLVGMRGEPVDRVGDALAQVGLGNVTGRQARHCSHGMQRRAEIALQLLTRPDLLLLDEPHSALDGGAAELVEYLAASVVDRGGAALVVSHDRDRVMQMTHRNVELVAGGLV